MRLSDSDRYRLKRSLFKRTTHPFELRLISPLSVNDILSGKIRCYEVCYVCGMSQDNPAHDGAATPSYCT